MAAKEKIKDASGAITRPRHWLMTGAWERPTRGRWPRRRPMTSSLGPTPPPPPPPPTPPPLPHPRPLPPRRRRRRPFSITSRWRAARKAIKSSLYDWTFLFFWFVFFVSSNNERTQLPRLLFRCGWNSGRVCVRLIRPVAIRKPAPIASSTRLCK